MGKGRKADVQFILPEPEAGPELEIVDEEYSQAPYTSILMSTAGGDGCDNHQVLRIVAHFAAIPC